MEYIIDAFASLRLCAGVVLSDLCAMGDVVFHPTLVEKYPWAEVPVVEAIPPDANKRGEVINLTVSRPFIIGNLRKHYRTPIYQAWAHLAAKLPAGLPNMEYLRSKGTLPTFTTLRNAHACFRGVERPLDSELDGKSVFIYVVKVPLTMVYNHAPPVSVPLVRRVDDSVVMTALVAKGTDLHQGSDPVWGTVLKLEWVESDPEDHGMPIDYKDRYDERVW